jgi:hypothetical protein
MYTLSEVSAHTPTGQRGYLSDIQGDTAISSLTPQISYRMPLQFHFHFNLQMHFKSLSQILFLTPLINTQNLFLENILKFENLSQLC